MEPSIANFHGKARNLSFLLAVAKVKQGLSVGPIIRDEFQAWIRRSGDL
jgi:hypothetical protein